MKRALKLKGSVTRAGTVRVHEKVDLPAGDVDVIVYPADEERTLDPGARPLRAALERLGGLWADRDDIEDGATYVENVRRRIEARHDRG